MTIARIKNNDDLQIKDEIIEYPPELEGRRNYFQNQYLSNNNNWHLATYSVTKKTFQLEGNTRYILHAEELKEYFDGEWGVFRVHDGTDGIKKFSDSGYVSSVMLNIFNQQGPQPAIAPFEIRITTPDSGKIFFSFFDRHSGNPPVGQWLTDKLVNAKLEKGRTPTMWTPAPEDLGMEYPDDIHHFSTGFRADGKVMVRELVGGESFSFDIDKKLYLEKLEEGVDLDGTT